ncbi:aquaporin AQPAe.a isoform X1 [Bactrocera neohumeralis]|uniref:aquaporin AQPAe.a isoform X1 n=1 Tax=Bactrocera tryoni TaxID=59916 RepID=UPI001A96C0AC|nr:aquaporin AQPAe.a isoform X1 [Bactrocera tryoni]XP_050324344.1 aquaporin AQPAe.a isoform X1 [Bactrocera neohumeralis]
MPAKFEYSLGIDELKSKTHRLWQALIAEFLGNFLLNFFACGACTQPEDGTFKAFAFGLAVFIAITVIGNISGGHVNPAVTVGLLVAGRVSVLRAVLYIIFQCLGSIAGTAAIRTLIDEVYYNGLGHTHLSPNITELQGLGIEFFLGLVLVLTVFGACDAHKPDSRYTAPLAIGLSVTLGHLGTIRYTGASMNPARTLGTAFAVDNWDAHWVYWVGPILGGIAAALIYTQVLEKPLLQTSVKVIEVSEKYRTHADEREVSVVKTWKDSDFY